MSLEQAKRLAGSATAGAISAATAAGGLLARGVSASARVLVPSTSVHPRERITFASLSRIDVANGGESAQAMLLLLLGYAEGWQAWALEDGRPRELTSKRDNSAVALLAMLPDPRPGMADVLLEARPLVGVVHAPQPQPPRTSPPINVAADPSALPSVVEQRRQALTLRLYSLRSHGYVRTLTFHQPILALHASERLLVVALPGQVQALDAGSLQPLFTCLAYLPPTVHRPFLQQGGGGEPSQHRQGGAEAAEAVATLAPLALGSRWLAYASNQAVAVESNQATAQRIPLRTTSALARRASGGSSSAVATATQVGASSRTGSGGGFTTAGMSEAALLAAQKGGQQLKAGLTAVGSASFKYLSNHYQQWRGSGMVQQSGMEVDEVRVDPWAC